MNEPEETWTVDDLLPTERHRRYPLQSLAATEHGRLTLGWALNEVQRRVRVECQGVDRGCGWRGYRQGGIICAADKPCPRCGSSVEVRERGET